MKERHVPDNQFLRDASGRLTFEMFRVPAGSYCTVCSALMSAFRLVPETTLVTNAVDIVFQDYRRGEEVVGLEWDNWSGFMVTAKTTASDSLVQDIGGWLLQSKWASESNSDEPVA
jgi:hypothetical protein